MHSQNQAAWDGSSTTQAPNKRYLKYLTKRFLKRNQMREWLRVVATGKNEYSLKFFNLSFEAMQDAKLGQLEFESSEDA
ncbi:hypothetical protein B0A53_02470 [Rhodotorula sp. CCFEE 5036]|nr:hypothetical protein B0A53_02470 [Rhodotorula sp. CCFEE 5036]